jgi:asparagine synthase (glutamine-hydrolysing)
MCGFLGLISATVTTEHLRQGEHSLSRRGPDSTQTWIDPSKRVGLLHARLSIVDPVARANQPLPNHNQTLIVAFNGEIYNHQELRQQFSDYPFQTKADTEVILACYEREGIKGLRHLKGMFSLALVDLLNERVVVLRDAIGKKPLFVAKAGAAIAFGSSMLALRAVLFAQTGERLSIKNHALDLYWRDGHLPAHESAFQNATPVLPGQALSFDFSGRTLGQTHIVPASKFVFNGESPKKCFDIVESLLTEAVSTRLEAQSNVSVLLSGGIDSTVVTHIAGKLSRDRGQSLHALTLASLVPNTNDERYARQAARKIGLKLTYLKLPRFDLAHRVCAKLDLQDEPLGFISYFLLSELVQAAGAHSRILLTGDGGDEVFMGYGKPADWRDLAAEPRANCSQDYIRSGPALPDWISSWGREMAGPALIGHGFTKTDRASAEQAIELRSPLLDWDVVSYARSLPYDYLFPKQSAKSLLKSMLVGWPETFVERNKLGFTYNLRWHWALFGFSGLREAFGGAVIPGLSEKLPADLDHNPMRWRFSQCLQHFAVIWKALAWQRFVQRALR